jgi:hypothetical protein
MSNAAPTSSLISVIKSLGESVSPTFGTVGTALGPLHAIPLAAVTVQPKPDDGPICAIAITGQHSTAIANSVRTKFLPAFR